MEFMYGMRDQLRFPLGCRRRNLARRHSKRHLDSRQGSHRFNQRNFRLLAQQDSLSKDLVRSQLNNHRNSLGRFLQANRMHSQVLNHLFSHQWCQHLFRLCRHLISQSIANLRNNLLSNLQCFPPQRLLVNLKYCLVSSLTPDRARIHHFILRVSHHLNLAINPVVSQHWRHRLGHLNNLPYSQFLNRAVCRHKIPVLNHLPNHRNSRNELPLRNHQINRAKGLLDNRLQGLRDDRSNIHRRNLQGNQLRNRIFLLVVSQ